MPRVKIDYVVSFSSEDPDNPASNLLAWEVSKKKWLCNKGEPSCSIVLQLTHAVKINAVHIGAYHSALVEVLVGRSEKPNEPFQVLVPSSVFISPIDSRRNDGVERVRSFSSEQLSDTKEQRWDRVRVVCSQPYNKHCKYGLSFVHIYEPEGKDSGADPSVEAASQPTPAVPARMMSFDTYSSDDDEFKPGELFAKHQQKINESSSTDAQIRQATSQALKNISEVSTKLLKTPICKTSGNRQSPVGEFSTNRQRVSLMYTDDDEQPHAKIDHIVNRHKDEMTKAKKIDEEKKMRIDEASTSRHSRDKEHRNDDSRHRKDDVSHSRKDSSSHSRTDNRPTPKTSQQTKQDSHSSSHSKGRENRKRPHSTDKSNKKTGPRPGPVSSSPHTILQGVVFVLSGYENPRRAAIRDAALAMGARFERDWGPKCTHLICAFPNTPKLKTVRSSPNGKTAVVVMGEWVEQCCERRRLLPWQWFATEPKYKVAEDYDSEDDKPSSPPSPQRVESDGGNTDDEIEKVLQNEKRKRKGSPPQRANKQRRQSSPTPSDTANVSAESDVAFVRDERITGNVTIDDSDTDNTEEEVLNKTSNVSIDNSKTLPDFFDGYTFAIDEGVDDVVDKTMLCRYVKAYGGVIVEVSEIDEDTGVDFLLCTRKSPCNGRTQAVRADWVWRCHENHRLYPVAEYTLT